MIAEKLSRAEEMLARDCLAKPELLTQALLDKRWHDVASVLTFIQQDVPHDMAMTDPSLYIALRKQITRFYLRGGGALNLTKIKALAEAQKNSPTT